MIYGRIYCITNLINGKKYVGQTTRSIVDRWRQHKRLTGGCRALSNAIKKYGADKFTHEELSSASSQIELDALEQFFIEKLCTIAPRGYNLSGGGFGSGIMNEETKEILRQKTTDRWTDQSFIDKQRDGVKKTWASPVFRANHEAAMNSAECKAKRSAATKKIWASPGFKEKHSLTIKNATNRPDVIMKQAEHSRAMWATPGHKEKMAAVMASPETRKRLAESNASEEVRARRSESAKLMWVRRKEQNAC